MLVAAGSRNSLTETYAAVAEERRAIWAAVIDRDVGRAYRRKGGVDSDELLRAKHHPQRRQRGPIPGVWIEAAATMTWYEPTSASAVASVPQTTVPPQIVKPIQIVDSSDTSGSASSQLQPGIPVTGSSCRRPRHRRRRLPRAPADSPTPSESERAVASAPGAGVPGFAGTAPTDSVGQASRLATPAGDGSGGGGRRYRWSRGRGTRSCCIMKIVSIKLGGP